MQHLEMLCNIGLLGKAMPVDRLFPSPCYYTALYPSKYPLAIAQLCTAFYDETRKPLEHRDYAHKLAPHFTHTQ